MILSLVASLALLVQAPPPGPSNPFCNTTPAMFLPLPDLPECEFWDMTCLLACADLYQTEMHLAYEWGCTRWAICDARYISERTHAEEDYMHCLTITAFEQQYQCTILYEADMDALHAGLDAARGLVNNGVLDRIQMATDSFCECVSQCCQD